MNKQLMFYSTLMWKGNMPVYGVIPCYRIAQTLEIEETKLLEAFESWIKKGMPKEFKHPVGAFFTSKRNEKRLKWLKIYYNPKAYYSGGWMKIYNQWGNNPDNIRGSDYPGINFGLEPILSIVTHETRKEIEE